MELSLTSGVAQLLTEISTKLMNKRGSLAGEGSELMHGVLGGPKSAYFGYFSRSSPLNPFSKRRQTEREIYYLIIDGQTGGLTTFCAYVMQSHPKHIS